MIHYLDTIRHFVAYTFQPYAWSPNISAAIVQAVVIIAVVKVLRKRFEAFAHRVVRKLVKPHLDAHLESVKAHLTAEIAKIK